jgi:DNA-binding beta-propeller fold protein YncE
MVAGIGVNHSGTVAVVANFYNDSITTVDLKARRSPARRS